MFEPKEGRGQRDEIVRDLLMWASAAVACGNSGFDKRRATARLFAKWPPSRIRTTSFGSAFTAHELGMTSKKRVDLFVIDTQNGFVLLIENRAGSAHKETSITSIDSTATPWRPIGTQQFATGATSSDGQRPELKR